MVEANFKEWIKADFQEWSSKADSTLLLRSKLFLLSPHSSPSNLILGEVTFFYAGVIIVLGVSKAVVKVESAYFNPENRP